MKRTPTAFNSSPASTSCRDFGDGEADFMKDVYEPSGTARRFLEIETAFYRAGYRTKSTELSPHPVAVFRFVRRTAPRFPDRVQFMKHVRQILKSVGIDVPKGDLTAEQTGSRALVSFLWTSNLRQSYDDKKRGRRRD